MIEKQTKNSEVYGQYGFWSLVATIVGTVIGIGIFFRASNVSEIAANPITSIFAWIIAIIFVSCMILAYTEIASSTKKGESSTLVNWVEKFMGRKFAMYFGVFTFYFYMPMVAVVLSYASSTFVLDAIVPSWDDFIKSNQWGGFFAVSSLAGLGYFGIFYTSVYSARASDKIQKYGTMIKLIPLLFVIFIGPILAATIGSFGNGISTPPDDGSGMWKNQNSGQLFLAMLLSIVPILFTFDGSMYVGSLRTELRPIEEEKGKFKKYKTFEMAMLVAILVISLIYLLYNIVAIWIGPLQGSGVDADGNPITTFGWSILDVIFQAVGGGTTGDVFVIIFSLLIAISGFTCVNGFATTATRGAKAMVDAGLLYDKNDKISKHNKATGTYKTSGLIILSIGAGWFFFSMITEIISYGILKDQYENGSLIMANMKTTNDIVDVGVILNFFTYSLLTIAAIKNRKTKKVNIEQKSYFLPTAWIAALGLGALSLFNIIMIFITAIGVDVAGVWPGGDAPNVTSQSSNLAQLIYIIVVLLTIAVITIANHVLLEKKKLGNNPSKEKDYRKRIVLDKFYKKSGRTNEIKTDEHNVKNKKE